MKIRYWNFLLSDGEIKLLRDLYKIHSPSGNEIELSAFVIKKLQKAGCKVWQDDIGNIYAQKGDNDTYPCVVAHLDQVQQAYPDGYMIGQVRSNLIGWSLIDKKQCGLGADDKNGIFIAIECARRFKDIKIAFFVSEEVGCVGSSQCDLDFFKDCRFIIEPDRKGNSDLITTMSGVPVCSEDFINAIPYKDFEYHIEDGVFTDVLELVERGVGISCINLSCGYYHPHTDHEVSNIYDLAVCRRLVFDIIEKCKDVYPFELPKEYKIQNYTIMNDYQGKEPYNYKDDYEYWQALYDEMNGQDKENNKYDIF